MTTGNQSGNPSNAGADPVDTTCQPALVEPSAEGFGTVLAEYQAITRGAGLVDLSARTRIELKGEDRSSFLHNMCTNEIRKLTAGAGCEAFLTDARGHILGHVFVLAGNDSHTIETVFGQEQILIAHLDRYLIRERVVLEGRGSQWGELLLAGPQAARVLGSVATASAPASAVPTGMLSHVRALVGGVASIVVRVPIVATDAFLMLCDSADFTGLFSTLRDAGAEPCGQDALEMARIEAGFPWFGSDITNENLPQEVSRDEKAISFTKGCYIGQETVARIDALGHVNKTLVGVRFAAAHVPPPGTEISAAGHAVGQVTSAAWSPRLNAPLALAYVRRGSNQAGASLTSALGPADVIALPLK